MDTERARTLAHSLMHQHGLSDWRFAFDNAKRRLGQCRYSTRTISLSRPLTLLNDEVQTRDTLLHEIAHALTPGAQHGPAWRRKCVEIGARPDRCARADEVEMPAAPYALACPHCTVESPRFRRPKRRMVCRACWERHMRGQGPRPEAMVVKDNRARRG